MKIKKSDLDYLLVKVMPGVGNNKLIPITSMLGIKYSSRILGLCTTDSINYVYSYKELSYVNEDFDIDICVDANLFSKLINKLTTQEVEIKIEDKKLNIVGNGDYNLPILLNENGDFATFTQKELNEDSKEELIKVQKLKDLKFYCEKSLSKNPENTTLNGYFVNNELGISTDRVVMTLFKEGFLDDPIVLRKSFVDLITNLNNDIIVKRWDGNIYVSDGETEIYSSENCSSEVYPISKLKKSMEKFEYPAKAKISLKDLSNILDRLYIFVNENGVVNIKLEDNKLIITEITTGANESLLLNDLDNNVEWNVKLDINILNDQIKAFKNEEAIIYLGNTSSVKIEENGITKIICLLN